MQRAGAVNLVASLYFGIVLPVNAATIVEIDLKPNSQSQLSRPAIDNVENVVAVGGVLDVDDGIGIIVKPSFLAANDHKDFALRQDKLPNSTTYGEHFPDAASSTVYYRFDQPTVVRYVTVVQHFFGATKIAGAAGDDKNNLQPINSVFGPAGDQTTGELGPDGTIHLFDLGSHSIAGTWFAMTVAKGNYPSAFAIHRAYPLDSAMVEIRPAVPEPSTWMLMAFRIAAMAAIRRR